jgi:branched-chain amino acid transport system ATP-binding protein
MSGKQRAPILELDGVAKSFGGLMAVDHCSFEVPESRITGLIGPNGAGKTTTFNLIAGVLVPDEGDIRFRGESIASLPPDRIARRGLVRTFQTPRIFARMTVWENLMFAVPDQPGEGVLHALWPNSWRRCEAELSERANEILEFIDLAQLADEYGGSLSGGQRKLLELGRALMLNPQVILLDEPTAGVSPTMRRSLIDRIQELNRRGTTFLIIEHDIDMIMRICHKMIVMHYGKRLAEGDPEVVRRDPRVLEAYLGGAVA